MELGDLGPFFRSKNLSIMENLYLSIDQLSPLHGRKKLELLFFRWSDYLSSLVKKTIFIIKSKEGHYQNAPFSFMFLLKVRTVEINTIFLPKPSWLRLHFHIDSSNSVLTTKLQKIYLHNYIYALPLQVDELLQQFSIHSSLKILVLLAY